MEKVISVFPDSGQKIVSIVEHDNYGRCIKKVSKKVDYISSMVKEINFQKNLNCEYYPKIFSFNIDETNCIIYEELIIGKNLDEIIRNDNIYLNNEHDCTRLLLELVIGLSFIWDMDIVHRDIKPANIIIREEDGKPVVLDLGIAKNLNSSTVTQGGMWGTECYASPEQILNNREIFGKKSDMFSLGVVIYELFYGIKPFHNNYDAILGNCNFNINDFYMSNDLQNIIRKMMEKKPHDRYRNSEQLLDDIKQISKGADKNE